MTAPSLPTLLPADDSGTVGDDTTNISMPRLVGTAEPDCTVLLVDQAGTILGYTAADASRELRGRSVAAAGGRDVRALSCEAVDAAGNVSPPSGVLSLTIDATPPAAPSTPRLAPTGTTPIAVETAELLRQLDANAASGDWLAAAAASQIRMLAAQVPTARGWW